MITDSDLPYPVVNENNYTIRTNRPAASKITFAIERAALIIMADNIVTRGALNKGLDAVGTQVVCMPIDDGACALTRKGEVALRACACALRKYRAFTVVNVVRAPAAV